MLYAKIIYFRCVSEAWREQNIDVNCSRLCSFLFIMQGERKDRGNWALFPENKSFATAVCACVCLFVFLGV